MSIEKDLEERSGNKCELCTSENNLTTYLVGGAEGVNTTDSTILICDTCNTQINDPETLDPNHWRCLNDSMWSEVDAVKVMAWRLLTKLKSEGWPQDLLDMMYLEEDTLKWAQAEGDDESAEDKVIHKDSNGVVLENGDSVVLIKDLNVKGGGFTAKRGTAVRRISLVWDNPEHIEGRVDGQHIVILTQYVKKI
ncbi:PhnA protein [Putridiphycobacter roseus]|uniref:PhnA protein n=1 Tax=Putridiphycobacter roseus TaxID=2219161 RepID=A0A2W1ND74_9FLAO|nr:alkylphosphonate utilization protein [Putridiphycobacter roseus]PZE17063.1 PhnA protein [Putridiphycobacter roseus]